MDDNLSSAKRFAQMAAEAARDGMSESMPYVQAYATASVAFALLEITESLEVLAGAVAGDSALNVRQS